MSRYALASLSTIAAVSASHVTGGYFANWAQYHPSPYNYTAESLSGVHEKLDILNYAFAYFCPPTTATQPYWVTDLDFCKDKQPYQLTTVEPKDEDFYKTVMGFKSGNPNLKTVLSVGGWNFPSNFWSTMVASPANRAAFISSCQNFMTKYGFDGIDLDWEFPCSEAREDPVQITCDFFYTVKDDGANCETDADGLLELVKEMRAAFGADKIISVASQAGMKHALEGFHLQEMTQYIDHFNLMSYDYSVSDIESANVTAPNMPLYTPKIEGVPEWGMDYSVQGYLDAGVAADKIILGVALYGHTWYVPGLTGDEWKTFGQVATVQGECCGPFKTTFGAKQGKGCSLCGTMMYSEIRAAGCPSYYDQATKSHIAYCAEASADGYTEAGTYITYNDLDSHAEIAKYVKAKGLKGAFVFDMSEDTLDYQTNTPTYEITSLYDKAFA